MSQLTEQEAVKREPVDYLYTGLNLNFIKLMAMIPAYAKEKYGAADQYTRGRLTGDKSPINHAFEHLRQYTAGEPHDKFGTLEMQLAAAAYNCLMEYYYLTHGGPTAGGPFYDNPA